MAFEKDEDGLLVLNEDEAIALLEKDALDIVTFSIVYDKFTKTNELQEDWPLVESALQEYGISCKLDLVEGCMDVSKTERTEDLDMLWKAREIMELLSRGVPVNWAIRILDCSVQHDIIRIGNSREGMCNIFSISREQFVERRKLLLEHIEALYELTGCGIMLKGTTVAVIGSLQGIKLIRRIVEDCIAHGIPPAPRVRKLKKKHHQKKNKRVQLTSDVIMNLESLCCN